MGYSIGKKIQEAGLVLAGLGTLGFIGLVFLILYGNLSGNLGFAANTAGANSTNAVINNVSNGFGTFFGFSNTLFTIAAVVVLIFMLVGLIAVIFTIYKGMKNDGEGFQSFD